MTHKKLAVIRVAAGLGVLVFAAGGCSSSGKDPVGCPAPNDNALVNLGCVLAEPPVVKKRNRGDKKKSK